MTDYEYIIKQAKKFYYTNGRTKNCESVWIWSLQGTVDKSLMDINRKWENSNVVMRYF